MPQENTPDARWTRLRPSRLRAELAKLEPSEAEALRLFVADYHSLRWSDDDDEPVELRSHREALRFARSLHRRRSANDAPPQALGNCPRCAGRGIIQAYMHLAGGRCLRCAGSGSI